MSSGLGNTLIFVKVYEEMGEEIQLTVYYTRCTDCMHKICQLALYGTTAKRDRT
ncbi:MAG TPA: hypothetical protein V6C95_04845 [Coleofasciculaceae cyanobacterium]